MLSYVLSMRETPQKKNRTCDSGVVGNARPCQGRDRGFEPRLSLLRPEQFLFWFFISTEPKKLPCDQISHPDRRAVFLYMYHGKNFHYGICYHPSVINAYLKINTMEMIQVRTFTSDAFAVKSLIRQYMI